MTSQTANRQWPSSGCRRLRRRRRERSHHAALAAPNWRPNCIRIRSQAESGAIQALLALLLLILLLLLLLLRRRRIKRERERPISATMSARADRRYSGRANELLVVGGVVCALSSLCVVVCFCVCVCVASVGAQTSDRQLKETGASSPQRTVVGPSSLSFPLSFVGLD